MRLDHQQVIEALPAYQIEGEIGRGGWGVVLSATHLGLGRRVAVKQLPRAFGADPAVRQRFKEEARLVASLTHPHIVPIFDFVEHEGLCLIVMELLTGGTLWDRFLNDGVPLDQACALILAACTALQHAHDHGILHRDIKPENFLFSESGTIKLGDFGIAKVIGQSAVALTVAGSVMGTPAYMAPEQALGQRLGPGTDIYSLGVMLYELTCGDLPFPETDDPLSQLIAKTDGEPRPLVELRADIHPALADVTMRSIARDPSDRQSSANELGIAVAEAATKAFGAGWLRRCGVEVMSAPQMIAITEQTLSSSAPAMHPLRLQRATSEHPRIGTVLKDTRLSEEVTPPIFTDVVGFVPAPSVVEPEPTLTGAAFTPSAEPAAPVMPVLPPTEQAPVVPTPMPAAPVVPAQPTPTPTPMPVIPLSQPTPASLAETQVPSWLVPPTGDRGAPTYPVPTPLPYEPTPASPAPPGTPSSSPSFAPTPEPPSASPPIPPAAPPRPAGGAPPSSSSSSSSNAKSVVILVGAIVIATVLIGGAYFITNNASPGATGPGPNDTAATTTALASTTSATSTSTSTSTSTTKAPLQGPQITKLTILTANSVSLDWVDTVDPTAAHVLIAYTTGGKKQQYPITDSPQDVEFPSAGSPYCFEIAAIGTTLRRSDPKCINGADPDVIVVHDDPLSSTTTRA